MFINPISYPGNKNKLLKEIIPLLPRDINTFVDVFCGSGIVGFNSSAQHIICNDINNYTLGVLRYFYETPADNVIRDIEEIIQQYGLTYSRIMPKGTYVEYRHEGMSRYNFNSYNQLKNDYNIDKSVPKLVVLLIYGFNHYLRFNAQGIYNVPVGKVDFSQSIYTNMVRFVNLIKEKQLRIMNSDFRSDALYQNHQAFYYFDPPYLITTAPYNGRWTEKEELALYDILDHLNEHNTRFALSNVLLSNGKRNNLLETWAQRYNIIPLKRQYRNANYQKINITDSQEVLITNYE